MLSALDLLESRGLPRRISLLSKIEAWTLDRLEQKDNESALARDQHHARSWKSAGSQLHHDKNHPLSWAVAILAMGELRNLAPISLAPISQTETLDYLGQRNNESSQDAKIARRGAVPKHHARTWNGAGSKLRHHALKTCTSCQKTLVASRFAVQIDHECSQDTIHTDSFRRGAPSRRHSRSLRASTMRHQSRVLHVDMPAPIPTGLPTQATPHVSCCRACSSTKIAAALFPDAAAALVPDAAASSALTFQQDLMQFFGIEPVSLPYACPLGGESPHKLQVCGGPALLETRCPYETIDDPRLHEILELLQQ